MASHLSRAIVLADDDATLLELLAQLLSGPDRTIETVCGKDGLSVDLLALSRPELVILNPMTGGLGPEKMAALVREVRSAVGARVVLMVDDRTDADLAAHRLGADAGVKMRVLLRDPLAQLKTAWESMAPRPTEPVRAPVKELGSLSANDIMTLDFGAPTVDKPPPPPPSPSVDPLRSAPAVVDLAKLIEDELGSFGTPAASQSHFDVVLDTLGDDLLYGPAANKPAGVFVSSAMAVRLGDAVAVTARFPWGHQLQWKGVVAWTQSESGFGRRKKPGFGVELKDLTDSDRAAMDRLCGLRAPLVVPPGTTKR